MYINDSQKVVQFCDDPQINIHNFIMHKKYSFSENRQRYWNSKFWTPKNGQSLSINETIRVSPPPPDCVCTSSEDKTQTSLLLCKLFWVVAARVEMVGTFRLVESGQ